MADNDKAIADILSRYDEPLAGNTWMVQSQRVILHKALERIAVRAGITWDAPIIVRAEADEAVILVTGRIRLFDDGLSVPVKVGDVAVVPPPILTERVDWSIGEAKINQNYRVSGKQAAYPYAMAEKRARDRVTLKLIGAHGLLYSESEADEFKAPSSAVIEQDGREPGGAPAPSRPATIPLRPAPKTGEFKDYPPMQIGPATDDLATNENVPAPAADQLQAASLKEEIIRLKTINEVIDFMQNPAHTAALDALPRELRVGVREHAKMRLRALGWPSKGA